MRCSLVLAAFLILSGVEFQPVRDRTFWIGIVKTGYQVPPGESAFGLLKEMNALLGSTDPVLRDDVAYGAAERWIARQKLLAADEQRVLLALWMANLGAGLGETGSDSVFRRSFSALNLSLLAALDITRPFMIQPEFDALLAGALDYLARERDTRGYDASKGWIHTPAHTADLLKFLARNPRLRPPVQAQLLQAISAKCAAVGQTFAWGEDERLGQVVRSIVRRQDFDAAAFEAWLTEAEQAHKQLWANAPRIDPAAFPRVQNLEGVLRAAFVALSADTDLSAPSTHARERLLRALARM
jgi:hypothetical protein